MLLCIYKQTLFLKNQSSLKTIKFSFKSLYKNVYISQLTKKLYINVKISEIGRKARNETLYVAWYVLFTRREGDLSCNQWIIQVFHLPLTPCFTTCHNSSSSGLGMLVKHRSNSPSVNCMVLQDKYLIKAIKKNPLIYTT